MLVYIQHHLNRCIWYLSKTNKFTCVNMNRFTNTKAFTSYFLPFYITSLSFERWQSEMKFMQLVMPFWTIRRHTISVKLNLKNKPLHWNNGRCNTNNQTNSTRFCNSLKWIRRKAHGMVINFSCIAYERFLWTVCYFINFTSYFYFGIDIGQM